MTRVRFGRRGETIVTTSTRPAAWSSPAVASLKAGRADCASYACKMYVITLVVIGLIDNQFPVNCCDIVYLLSNKSDDTVHITQNHTTAIIVTLDATSW